MVAAMRDEKTTKNPRERGGGVSGVGEGGKEEAKNIESKVGKTLQIYNNVVSEPQKTTLPFI